MISGKGVLYTVLGAASAAVVVGTMLTKGRSTGSGGTLAKATDSIQKFLGIKSKGMVSRASATPSGELPSNPSY